MSATIRLNELGVPPADPPISASSPRRTRRATALRQRPVESGSGGIAFCFV